MALKPGRHRVYVEGKHGRQSRVAGRGCSQLWAVTVGAGEIALV